MDLNNRYTKLLVFTLIMLIKKGASQNQAPGTPVVTKHPTGAVIAGKTITALCTSVGGNPAPTLTWYRGNQELEKKEHTVLSAQYQLTLTHTVEFSDKNNLEFKCEAANTEGSSSDSFTLVDVYLAPETPSIVTGSSSINADVEVKFFCRVASYPVATVYWIFGTETLKYDPTDNDFTVTQEMITESGVYKVNSTLTRTVSAADNNKKVWCVVEQGNTLGSGNNLTSSPVTLTVHGKPTVSISPPTFETSYGSDVKITCTVVSSLSSYTVTWYKVNSPNADISIVSTSNQYSLSSNGVELTIINVDLTDPGSYYCIAKVGSLVSDKSNGLALSVYKIPDTPVVSQKTDKLIDGKPAQFTCVSQSGYPEPVVTWSVVGVSQPSAWSSSSSESQNGQGLYTVTGQLSFQVSSALHQKNLICTVTQSGKAPQTSQKELTVHVKPTVSVDTPKVATVGTDVSVSCKVVSTLADPLVTWYLVGGAGGGTDKQLVNGVDYALNGVVLTVKNFQASDEGQYYCRAQDEAGLSDPSNNVQISSKPFTSITPSEVSVHSGSNLVLSCIVQPYDAATTTVTWYKLNLGQLSHGSKYLLSGITLTILNVLISDEGKYYCKASNNVGESGNSNTITLNVMPTVSASPLVVNINAKESATFTCSVTSTSTFSVAWFKEGSGSALVAGAKYTFSGNSLTVVNSEQEDEGKYYCIATSSAGQSVPSNTVSLNLQPRASISPTTVGADLGSSVSFTCSPLTTLPVTTITWYKTAVASPLSTGSDYTISTSKTVLTVLNVKTSHEGSYYCAVETSIGTGVSNSVTLAVKPSVSVSPATVVADPGGSASFTCSVTSSLANTVQWYKQGSNTALTAESDYSLTTTGITILDVQQADEGNYFCHATSSAGRSPASNMAALVLKPIVTISPSRVGASLGENTKFDCSVVSSLTVNSIKWYKSGDSTPLSSGSDYTISGISLTILNVQWSDQGNYYCAAETSASTSNSNNVRLDVKPVVQISPPGFYNVDLESSVTLTCTVTSTVGATVSWFDASTNQKLQPTVSKYEIDVYTLKILNVAFIDQKSYYCNAKSDVGTSDNSNSVTLQVKPSPTITPATVGVDEDDDVSFTCVVASTLQITSIQWFKSGVGSTISTGGQFTIDTVSKTGDRLTISKVKQANTGQYYCNATSSAGSSDSKTVQLNLKPAVSISPASVSVKLTEDVTFTCSIGNQQSVTVTWYKEATPNPVQISASNKYKIPVKTTLTVTDVAISDEGDYYCSVLDGTTGETGRSNNVTLSPYKQPTAPSLSVQPDTLTIGTALTATCVTNTGYPKPTIAWLRNNVLQTSGDITPSETFSASTGFSVTSVLKRTVAEGDASLTCRVAHSQSLGSSYLTKTQALTIHVKPTVTVSQATVGVFLGEDAEFECSVISFLNVNITWFKKSSPTDEALSTGADYTLLGTKLTVKSVSVGDEGDYYCKSANLAGVSDPSNIAKLIVKPTVVASPATPNIEINKDVTLDCDVTSTQPATTQWYNASAPNTVITAVSEKIILTGTSLTIKAVKPSDEGTYFCLASNIGGKSANSNSVTLTVYNIPTLVGSSWTQKPGNAIEGETVTFSCSTKDGYPKPTIKWLLDGSLATGTENEDLVSTDVGYTVTSHLSFTAATATHNQKTLTCRVSHSKLNSPLTFAGVLQIHSKPLVDITPGSVQEKVGEKASLECRVTSTLPHNITWYKTSGGTTTQLTASSKYTIDAKTLSVDNLVLGDQGNYFCKAENEAGATTSTEVVFTVYTPPSKPTIESSTTSIAEFGDISATCRSTANPQDSIQFRWTFGSNQVSTTAQLSITNAGRATKGIYTCTASNDYGSETTSFEVDVKYKPESAVTQSAFTATVSNTVTLDCATNANPVATDYTWTKAGENIVGATSQTHTVTVESGTVSYACVAINAEGSSAPISFTVSGTSTGVGSPSSGASTEETGLSSGAIAAIVLGVIFILLIIIVIIVCCCSHGKCGKKETKRKVTPQPEPKRKKMQPKMEDPYADYMHAEYDTYYDRYKDPRGYREPSAISRTHVDVDIEPYRHHYSHGDRSQRYVSNFYAKAPAAVESENGTIISVYDDKDQLVSGKYGVLPPLNDRYTYLKEEDLRKKRRKKKKKKQRSQHERGTGEGQESPKKEKRRYKREDGVHRHHSPTRNGIPPDISLDQGEMLQIDYEK